MSATSEIMSTDDFDEDDDDNDGPKNDFNMFNLFDLSQKKEDGLNIDLLMNMKSGAGAEGTLEKMM